MVQQIKAQALRDTVSCLKKTGSKILCRLCREVFMYRSKRHLIIG
jgi:hypothetical protein